MLLLRLWMIMGIKYLLVIKNLDPMQTRQANDLIRLQNPETVQGYTDSGAV